MPWLAEHIATRKVEVSLKKAMAPEGELRDRAALQAPPRPFLAALRKDTAAVIAEIKFRSPSQGTLRPEADVEAVAQSYARGGASALSVLIDERHFGGQLEFLTRARMATKLPVLAKGFLVDPYDIVEARAAGADAVLLIASCLSREELEAMHAEAKGYGMAALVELHGDEDLAKVEGLDLELVGVNHRNLDTLKMDMALTERLAPRLPARALKVAESGIQESGDLTRMKALGYDAVLVGTRFMKHADPGLELAKLLGV